MSYSSHKCRVCGRFAVFGLGICASQFITTECERLRNRVLALDELDEVERQRVARGEYRKMAEQLEALERALPKV